MNIEEIEGEIRQKHLHDERFAIFWKLHLKPVIDYSKDLAVKYNANQEIVWLSAILHDIARLDGLEPHDEVGAEKAYEMLIQKGFKEDMAQRVKETILTHRCKKHKPEALEQKILATADALSHFKPPFYFWFKSQVPLEEKFSLGLLKLERDYRDKIFFDEERESVKIEYDLLRKWFSFLGESK